MLRFRNVRHLVAAVAAAVVLVGSAPKAKAAFVLTLSEDGGPATSFSAADFTTLSYNSTFGDFKIVLFGASSDNGGPGNQSDLLSANTKITNLDTTTAHVLTLSLTQTNYTLPTGTTLYTGSGMGGSVDSGTLGLTTFQAYFDKNNAQFGTTTTSGLQVSVVNGSSFQAGGAFTSFSRDNATDPYSISSVTNFALSAGGSANYSNSVATSTSRLPGDPLLPAPAGLVLALTGMPVLGLRAWIRRRTGMAQNS